MTLWNPLNVFSGRAHSAADGPSASFDPSRTGDPLGPRPSDPAIGIGGTQIGGPVSTGDPRRHPIGFAPPADQDAEPRFRTEISFKRHHELPRASTTPVFPEDGVQSSWQSPEQVGSVESEQVDSFDVDQVDAVELPPVAESVPFFKREISFRRKKKDAGEEVVAEETQDDLVDGAVDESSDDADATDEVTETTEEWEIPAVEVFAASADEPEEHEAVVEEHEDIVEADEPETLVVAEAVSADDDADTVVPFYKREISFRRKKNAAEVVAAAEVVEAVGDEDTSDASDEPAEVEVEPEFVAAVDEPERPRQRGGQGSRRGADRCRGRRSRRVRRRGVAGRGRCPGTRDRARVRPGSARHGRRGARGAALSRHHRARVAHGGHHARARDI